MKKVSKQKAVGGKKPTKPRLAKTLPKFEEKDVNVITAPTTVGAIMRKAKTGPVRIKMREAVSDIVVGEDFSNTAAIVNPGNEELFPWLSTIAQQFTSYHFERLNFEYVASANTGTGGKVALALNADAEKPPFLTMAETTNHVGSASAAPWVPFKIDSKQPTMDSIKKKFVADVTGEPESVIDDLHTVADGVLNIATAGLNLLSADRALKRARGEDETTDTTGSLYADYSVMLFDPVTELPADQGVSYFETKLDLYDTPVDVDGGLNPLGIQIQLIDFDTNAAQIAFTATESGTYVINMQMGLATPSVGDYSGGTSWVSVPGGQSPEWFNAVPVNTNHVAVTQTSEESPKFTGLVAFGVFENLLPGEIFAKITGVQWDSAFSTPLDPAYSWCYVVKVNSAVSTAVRRTLRSINSRTLSAPGLKGSHAMMTLVQDLKRRKVGEILSAAMRRQPLDMKDKKKQELVKKDEKSKPSVKQDVPQPNPKLPIAEPVKPVVPTPSVIMLSPTSEGYYMVKK